MIGVTLLGQHLPGSPYVAHATPPLPSAPHCVLRGVALTSAVARREETFEIQFRDYLCAPPYVSRAYGTATARETFYALRCTMHTRTTLARKHTAYLAVYAQPSPSMRVC